jgi:hypothetical protein
MRRILNQSANAAVKAKGNIFEIVYRSQYRVSVTKSSGPGRECPACGKSKGFVIGSLKTGGFGYVEW